MKMWIVVVVDNYYPSVFHFDNEEEARKSYEKERFMGHAVHLAEVKESKFDKEVYEFDESKPETIDVEWYTDR